MPPNLVLQKKLFGNITFLATSSSTNMRITSSMCAKMNPVSCDNANIETKWHDVQLVTSFVPVVFKIFKSFITNFTCC
jgi:hypothetical protein